MPTLRIPTAPVFRPLLEPARYKGAYGGRGSGKSHFFGELMVERCLVNPGTLAVCIREVQKSLLQSSKRLIESKIQSLGVGAHFQVFHDRIVTPGDGLIIFQGMQDSTAESIKSLEGFDIAWVEEAQTLSARSLSLLRPTIRKEGSELWANWNPRRKSLIAEAEAARAKAMSEKGGAAAAVSALTAKAKLAGMWREKVDQHNTGTGTISTVWSVTWDEEGEQSDGREAG